MAMNWTVVEYRTPGPLWVHDRVKKEREIRAWCDEHFPSGNWQVFQERVYFETPKDATAFALRWA